MIEQIPILILAGLGGLFLVFWIFRKPFLGIAFTVASLPILDLLPEIPYFSSVVPLVGGLTLIAYLVAKREGLRSPVFKLTGLQIVSLLFIVWVFVSNPEAAVLGTGRNWLLTFFQLWVLLYLAGELLDTPAKQRAVMLVFSGFSIISAFYAIQSGFIGETFDLSLRSEGFFDNANAAARFFVVSMVLLTYLRSEAKRPAMRNLALLGILITYLGVFYTLSRTGMILLFGAQGLILFLQTKGRQRVGIIFVFMIGLVIIWFLAEPIFDVIESIVPIIINREDTFGLRLNLWQSAWQMWLDHPLRGVGVGNYANNVGLYMLTMEGPRVWSTVTHNTYLQVLSETGIIGFGLFISMLGMTIKNFIKTDLKDGSQTMTLRKTWLIVFIVLLIGGITKSDHADKFSWMVMGLSVFFAGQAEAEEVDGLVVTPEVSKKRVIRT